MQGSSEVSVEDYQRIHLARKQHELELQAQARRELRAARRKASAERAASERALQQPETQELAASSAPAIASRSDTRPGQWHCCLRLICKFTQCPSPARRGAACLSDFV